MILLETEELYYSTQVYFRKNLWINMPQNENVWATRYNKWLRTQGCVIVKLDGPNGIPVVRNVLGVAPGHDKFGFERPEDATLFKLRWS